MYALIVFCIFGAAIAAPKTPPRVVGGINSSIEKWPFLTNMMLGFDGINYQHACGGTLLTSRTILSAGHCYFLDPVTYWRVRLGSSYRSYGGDVYDVGLIIVHENWATGSLTTNDIGLVFLAESAVFSEVVGTASIAASNFNLPDGTEVTTIGWGTTSSDGVHIEPLQEAQFNIINHDLCKERYVELREIYWTIPLVDETMICAGILDFGGVDACQGDSGGPIVLYDNIVVGIVSWGYGCGHEYYPGVKTKVSHFTDWIVEHGTIYN